MIKAKKSLGQNFLIDKNILEKIVNIIEIQNKTVFEVGPGTGNLTLHFIKRPKKIFVVEKDKNLAIKLSNNFKDKIKVINKDILLVDEKILIKINLLYLVICHITFLLKYYLNGS